MRNKADNTPALTKSSDKGFDGLYGNKQYNVALYADVIIGTNLKSLANTWIRRFNPIYEKKGGVKLHYLQRQ